MERFGAEFVRGASPVLRGATWQPIAACIKCQGQCQVAPTLSLGRLWLECSGNVCVGFSTMGLQNRWPDPSAVAALTWVLWAQHHKPDIILVECVSNLVSGPLDLVLFDEWFCVRNVYCPTDLAPPVRRKRIYMC